VAQQSAAFGYSVIMGIALGIIYGLLRLWRTAFCPGRLAVVLSDSCFMLVWSLAIFFFSLAFLSGFVRVYVVAGSLAGLVLYRLTVGRVLFRIYSPIIRITKKALQKICEKIKKFARYLLKIACKLLYNINSGLESLKKKRNIKSDCEKRNLHEQKKKKRPKKHVSGVVNKRRQCSRRRG